MVEEDGPEKREPQSEAPGTDSSVYARGQTVIPKVIRDSLAIEYGTKLHWEVREGVIHVMPLPKNPVQALRGILKGTGYTFQQFMAERKAERAQERALEERQGRP
jgi:bifunctional DNA-binding transcriptional regulator/antitoxin component of YhaV-PrlF toxin-antitoxin module